MYHVPPLHVTDGAKGTTGSLQFETNAVAGAARTSWIQLRAALGAPTPDFSSRFTPEAFSMNEYSRKAAEVFRVVQQFQTGTTFLKRAFKVELFSCLIQNSIGRVENFLLTIERTTLNYDCNMDKRSSMIYL